MNRQYTLDTTIQQDGYIKDRALNRRAQGRRQGSERALARRRVWNRVRAIIGGAPVELAWMPARVEATYYDFQLNDIR